jgi:hypothetical protein
MERVYRWIVALGSILFVLGVSSYAFPELACLLVSILVLATLVVLLTASLVSGLMKWRKFSKFWPMPALVCGAFILCWFYLASPTGRYLSDRIFERHLGDYARVVDNFKSGSVLCASACKGDINAIETTDLPAHVLKILGTHCDGNGVVVLFLRDTDVPLLHEGYMFKDYEEGSDCSKRFGARDFVWLHLPYVRPIEGHWYRFSDEPGF